LTSTFARAFAVVRCTLLWRYDEHDVLERYIAISLVAGGWRFGLTSKSNRIFNIAETSSQYCGNPVAYHLKVIHNGLLTTWKLL
jgi:hypothetical protein